MKPLPMRLGDLSVGFIHSLADAVRSHDLDPQPLLEQYGLDAARLPRPKGATATVGGFPADFVLWLQDLEVTTEDVVLSCQPGGEGGI